MPPVTVRETEPFDPALQLTLVAVALRDNAVGCVIVLDVVDVHPLLSVIVTL